MYTSLILNNHYWYDRIHKLNGVLLTVINNISDTIQKSITLVEVIVKKLFLSGLFMAVYLFLARKSIQ